MRILIIGKGKMGQTFFEQFKDEVIELIDYEIDVFNKEVDGVIDFSHPDLIENTLSFCVKNKLPLVIGTTNFNEEQIRLIEIASKKIPICLDSNFSLGILNLKKCIESLSLFNFEEIVITEEHHKDKIDSPSGTAKSLKTFIQKMFLNEVKIISIRKDNIFGIHKIEFVNKGETISLVHDAKNRSIFAKGARMALDYISNKKAKLYSFGEIING